MRREVFGDVPVSELLAAEFLGFDGEVGFRFHGERLGFGVGLPYGEPGFVGGVGVVCGGGLACARGLSRFYGSSFGMGLCESMFHPCFPIRFHPCFHPRGGFVAGFHPKVGRVAGWVVGCNVFTPSVVGGVCGGGGCGGFAVHVEAPCDGAPVGGDVGEDALVVADDQPLGFEAGEFGADGACGHAA